MNTATHNTTTSRNTLPLEDLIRELNLEPLIGEGGFWAQGYVSDEVVMAGQYEGRPTERPLYGTIYFVLTPNCFSCMHCLPTDEVWYHHQGPAVKLLLISPTGYGTNTARHWKCEVKVLGQDIARGERPQIMVPRGTWQGAIMCDLEGGDRNIPSDAYTLMSTSMAPAYQLSDFETASYDELAALITNRITNRSNDSPISADTGSESTSQELLELLRQLTGEPLYQ